MDASPNFWLVLLTWATHPGFWISLIALAIIMLYHSKG